jgi:hypothetical protein
MAAETMIRGVKQLYGGDLIQALAQFDKELESGPIFPDDLDFLMGAMSNILCRYKLVTLSLTVS